MEVAARVPSRRRAARTPAPVRREQLLDAAIEAFAESGFRGASTAGIAARLGVSEPTLFRHFESKRALYLAAIDRSADRLIEQWRALSAGCATPLEALLEIGRWYAAELQRDSRHLLLRLRSYGEAADPEVVERIRARFREVFAFVQELHERARREGLIAADTDTHARTWLFMAIGTLLDVTQVLGLRSDLRIEDMPGLMLLALPPRTSQPAHARAAGRSPKESR
jgi:AcrR family transcriptional regulator